jgi:putative nucleotidyltransferase with HDIG domain
MATASKLTGEMGNDVDRAEAAAAALEIALRARAPAMQRSSAVVVELAVRVGQRLGLSRTELRLLRLGARLRDVGMLCLPDSVVLATGRLPASDWQLLVTHPALGSELLQMVPELADVAEIVRAHHERWDGEGYPDGRRGEEIPWPSRIIAACDAFVAITADRPHRRGVGPEVAIGYIQQGCGSHFDARTSEALVALVTSGDTGSEATPGSAGPLRVAASSAARAPAGSARGLRAAIETLDVFPALGTACDRALRLNASDGGATSELVAEIEGDMGLTVAILRAAQPVAGKRPIANIPQALSVLATDEIAATIRLLPRVGLPRAGPHSSRAISAARAHALVVARAANRIAQETGFDRTDDLLVAALLHDVGKLVLARLRPDYATAIDDDAETAVARTRAERRTFGLDHASVGAILSGRWGLPAELGDAIASHHTSEHPNQLASYLNLADMIVHRSVGHDVNRERLVRLAESAGLSLAALRDVIFDLPRADGSLRRRAAPSVLSTRETEALRLLAEGHAYKTVAVELGISINTVRSHMHHAYEKLSVTDRAQAVLRATELGWI